MSYITVPAEKIIKCCEAFIAQSDFNMAYNAAEMLKRYANQRISIFSKQTRGYQGAFDYLENTDDFANGLKWSAKFWKSENREAVERLLILAKHGDPVIISDEHAFILEWGN